MTARQRPASGSAAAPIRADSPPANGVVNGEAAPLRWEEWFAAASPDQRAEALALAQKQGLVYAQQLPVAHGKAHGAGATATLVPFLTRVLAGKCEALSAVAGDPLDYADSQLDALQREAVRRALGTPDVCLLRGLPGTGKSRVVVETIVQAARRGWRVLLLAPTAPAVDVVLERLLHAPEVLPIRMLAQGESVEALPPSVRRLTLAEQRRSLRERAVDGARQACRQAEETLQRRLHEEKLWPQFLPLAQRHQTLDQRLLALQQRVAAIGGEVQREAAGLPYVGKAMPSGPFASEVVELHKRHAAALAESESAHKTLQDERDTLEEQARNIAAELARLEPKCRARQDRRWWTLAYWTGGSAPARRETLQTRQHQIGSAERALADKLVALAAERGRMDAAQEAERRELIAGETERRQAELAAAVEALERERRDVSEAWQALAAPLEPATLRPDGRTPVAIEAARLRWQAQIERDEAGCRFARQWAAFLDQAGAQTLPSLPASANVLAGPTAAVAGSREWAEGADFDLLIVDEADALSETELLRLAAHAPRLLLVGPASAEGPPVAAGPRSPRAPHSLASMPGCWARLCQALGDDLAQLPYRWQRTGERLVCHLVTVRAEDERHLEREVLADAPDIELSILNLPRCRPQLARVSFPGRFAIPEATAFIFRELQELPIEPLGRTAWWQETDESLTFHLGPLPAVPVAAIDLGSGVGIGLVASGHEYAGRAARIDFARSSGWDRPGACRWLQAQLKFADRERSVFLQVPHRMNRSLADVVGPLLFPEACLGRLLGAEAATDAAFEFVAVPVPRKAEWPREGAGLEQDLSAGRHGDRVPSDLRAELPRRGIVNYLEAQALVRRLERWAQMPAELAANGKAPPSVLVLALYEAQAEMLRRLVARSTILHGRGFALEITVPSQARHRECDVLVLSLTRSHAHRCVPYGEDVADLALALTRPRQRLLVFGDLGTLVKRTQWQGPLDHLDAPAAHLEGVHLSRLVQRVQST